MRFIDLFAGLGGFHVALSNLGHTCVLASEIDPSLQSLYEKNFGIKSRGDVRKLKSTDIPQHDILCAGFPCQPFSKAGEQAGLNCPTWGDLFDQVVKILRSSSPKFFILENVPNLERHDDGKTWAQMREALEKLGYAVESRKLSPHQFGIPQIRERLFVVGNRDKFNGFQWPTPLNRTLTIKSVLDVRPKEAKTLPDQVVACMNVWQDFLDRSPRNIELPSFPIWTMEFGANYPFEEITPHQLGTRALLKYRGSHGQLLKHFASDVRIDHLPPYARSIQKRFPVWKVQFIRQNRKFYADNKRWIRPWLKQILGFPPSLQKLEWNCKGERRDIWRYVIQFRASGVRVKRQTTAPSLVAMTTTQVPIIAWERRYMTPRECARLQSLERLRLLPVSAVHAYRALGNAVNARVVELVARELLDRRPGSYRVTDGTANSELVA